MGVRSLSGSEETAGRRGEFSGEESEAVCNSDPTFQRAPANPSTKAKTARTKGRTRGVRVTLEVAVNHFGFAELLVEITNF